jgi:hypothetical protein
MEREEGRGKGMTIRWTNKRARTAKREIGGKETEI